MIYTLCRGNKKRGVMPLVELHPEGFHMSRLAYGSPRLFVWFIGDLLLLSMNNVIWDS